MHLIRNMICFQTCLFCFLRFLQSFINIIAFLLFPYQLCYAGLYVYKILYSIVIVRIRFSYLISGQIRIFVFFWKEIGIYCKLHKFYQFCQYNSLLHFTGKNFRLIMPIEWSFFKNFITRKYLEKISFGFLVLHNFL